MRYYSIIYCRAFLWILDNFLLYTVLAPVDYLPSVASSYDIVDSTRSSGYLEESLTAFRSTSIVI
jgi:hypothetical protein